MYQCNSSCHVRRKFQYIDRLPRRFISYPENAQTPDLSTASSSCHFSLRSGTSGLCRWSCENLLHSCRTGVSRYNVGRTLCVDK